MKWIYRIIYLLITIIANTGTYIWLIFNCIEIGEPIRVGKEYIQLSYLDALDFKWKILIYVSSFLGVVFTIWFLIKLHKSRKEDKKHRETVEAIKSRKDKYVEGY